MAMQWIEDVRQTALIDEAEQLAVKHLQAPFAEVRAHYQVIGFDVEAFANELKELAARARQLRARAMDAQARYRAESGDARDVVAEVGRWIEQLHLVVRFAKASDHPQAKRLDDLIDQLAAESWSKSRHSVEQGLVALGHMASSLESYGLQPGFVDLGHQLAQRLDSERAEQVEVASERILYARQLQEVIGRIVKAFERIAAARDLVSSVTGEELPGLELNLVRSAAARRAPPPEPRVEPEPEPVEPNGL